jgi:plasmid stability protein
MRSVPTLHIRNVPQAVYDALRLRAMRASRSLNAEVIETLEASVAADADADARIKRLDELRSEWLAPADLPRPEELIREQREERSRHVDRISRGL